MWEAELHDQKVLQSAQQLQQAYSSQQPLVEVLASA
jgi:hypothetical protein